MKFARLKLVGFKSFTDPTELVLEPGLTGVVGPNGCGKSNLVEALRWVMGESSYKAMRAAGMDEVIFSGSANRPARNSAEVTLVLDNSDRTAPAGLNTADILEVTRRIEREEGSVYRVNGREVRARDVQLLFADASTGAHSPALVRQGQIGELIAAKPVQRRALLEEAAGISGLHSRRHEAELRLKAAEQNLDRVDDIVAQVETQLEALKRQARLAVRYRALSGDIRKAEAALFHLRWVAARVAEKETEAQQGGLISKLADANHAERQAAKALEITDAALQPLRDAEAAAGAVLQRLTIVAEQLDEEARRAGARRAELVDRRAQLVADAEREATLGHESETALGRYAAERAGLTADVEGEAEALVAARAEADSAVAAVGGADAAARRALDALALLRAQRAQAERQRQDAAQRRQRLSQQVAEVEREAKALADDLARHHGATEARELLEAAQAEAESAESSALAAEEASRTAQAAVDAARPQLAEADAGVNRLDSEARTLARILHVGEAALWPSIVDALKVTPGYETALGAALGEDLEASSDGGAPLHWAGPMPVEGDPDLPLVAKAMADFVTGSPLLERRLRQVGLISKADGPRLMARLKPGQMLVTLDGDVWRWDGFVAAADAPSAAAERLAQRNRLADLDAELSQVRRERDRRKADFDALGSALDTATQAERTRRDAWREAQRRIGGLQAGLDRAQAASAALVNRQGALEEARVRLASNLSEAEAMEREAMAALADGQPAEEAAELAKTAQAELDRARSASEQARLTLGSLESAQRLRAQRLGQIAQEEEAWQRRRNGARAQLETLSARARDIDRQLGEIDATPQTFAARRAELDAQIAEARLKHAAASDTLSKAQAAHRDADRAARAAMEALSLARETLGRLEERLKGLIGQRLQIERQVLESLDIAANATAEAAGIKAQDALPQESHVEQKLERLKAERERLGGVNLTAEREAEEVQGKLNAMVKDRDELVEAIAKLRTGISSLNREGRARLNEAFDKVNAYFAELFTSLFGGGTAELKFVESDDPLEAGLEIIAKPPGKKPQTMTLLSGGEQALTALSLIFAVFLTNPAPICVLDEVDAPLDDANVERFCTLLDTMCARTETRFLVITHNPITMARVDRLFGVTMAERGVSQLVSVDLTQAEAAVRQAG